MNLSLIRPLTFQQPLAQTGVGAFPSSGAVLLGFAVAAGGAYGGYLIGAKAGAPKHKTAGKIIGAIAGWFLVPAVIGTIMVAVSAPNAPVQAQAPAPAP